MSNSHISGEPDRLMKRMHLHDRLASWILFAVIVALLVALGACVIQSCKNHVNVHRIEIAQIPCDSISITNLAYDGKQFLISQESLDSIVSRLELHEAELNQKYQYILQKRDEEDNYRNIFMLVFGIAVSVAGFFGYRSFSNIEEKAVSIADSKATKVVNDITPEKAETKAAEVAQNYCDENVSNHVNAYLAEHLQEEVTRRVNELYTNEGRASIVSEATDNAVSNLQRFIHSDGGKTFIRNEIISEMSEEVNSIMNDNIPRITSEIRENLANGNSCDQNGDVPEGTRTENNGDETNNPDVVNEADRETGIPEF